MIVKLESPAEWNHIPTHIYQGDCRDVMASLEPESVDAIVTDPPYGLSFMGKEWDHGVPGESFWREALRVAKPGAYLLAFGGTRTYHRLACAIEDAGWEIRDCLGWLYGSGFPKSHDISKAIDKAAGAEREVVGVSARHGGGSSDIFPERGTNPLTAPATDDAKRYDGWGTCLKPAWEPIVMARKPLVGTVANNVLTYGTGGINIDASRVTVDDDSYAKNCSGDRGHADNRKRNLGFAMGGGSASAIGRFPANIIHDGSEEVLELFPQAKGGTWNRTDGARHFDNNGEPTGYITSGSDTSVGSAARFFYCAKASKSDRGEGNTHPTVKPTSLMEYLVRMVTPEGGVVLDPFMGSGSTLKAASRLGFDCIGIDLSADYCDIAAERLDNDKRR